MNIPIESPDIRAVYFLEISGQRADRQPKRDPRIARIRRKLFESLKAKRILIEGMHVKTGKPFTS